MRDYNKLRFPYGEDAGRDFRFIWGFDDRESWRAGVSAALMAGFRFLDWVGGVVICDSFHFDLSQSLGWDDARLNKFGQEAMCVRVGGCR